MNSIRNLIAVLSFAFATAALAQPVQLLVPFGPGGSMDMIARHLAKELGPILGRVVVVDNRPGANGQIGVELVAARPADGSNLILHRGLAGTPIPSLNRLVPVAIISGGTPAWAWIGVFAPPGTPDAVVGRLSRAVVAAANASSFRQAAREIKVGNQMGFTPTPGDGANLDQIVRQAAAGPVTAAAPTPSGGAPTVAAPQARTPAAPSGGNSWPAGVAPGNMYIVEYRRGSYPVTMYALVAAKSKADATALIDSRWEANLQRSPNTRGTASGTMSFEVSKECTGPGWGAVVWYRPGNARGRERLGADCGKKTPRDAIMAAVQACSIRTGTSCDSMEDRRADTLIVSIGHSGAKGWSEFPFGGYPPEAMRWAALGATTSQFSGTDFVNTPQDAIDQFSKACGPAGAPGVHSCWITSRNWPCLNNANTKRQGDCVDTKLTSQGYVP